MKTLPLQTIYFLMLEDKRIELVRYIKDNMQEMRFSEIIKIVKRYWPHGVEPTAVMAKALCCHFLNSEREKLSENIEMINAEIRKIKAL